MFFGKKKKKNKPIGDLSKYAKVFNYIKIDSIDGKPMVDFMWEYGEKKKGLLAKKVEIIYLTPGIHKIIAHGVTYQTKPTLILVDIEANQSYLLGAGPNEEGEGLFFEQY